MPLSPYNFSLNLLSRREYSRLEITNKLKLQGYPDSDILCALEKLSGNGLQCDSRFCENYVRYRQNRGFGPNKIRIELVQKGVSSDIISKELYSIANDWQSIAHLVWKKKFANLSTDIKQLAKQKAFLIYRGFEIETINDLFKTLQSEMD